MIRNEETGWTEAEITINGTKLNFAQAMSVRVAIQMYLMWLAGNRDELGSGLADGYRRSLLAVNELMHHP